MTDSALVPRPLIQPLGDRALLVRFGDTLTDQANRAAIALAHKLQARPPVGVVEIDPNLISVLVRYNPADTSPAILAGELRLATGTLEAVAEPGGQVAVLPVRFAGEDIEAVAAALNLSVAEFVARHNARPLRVLSTGFAPGFLYCGFHDEALRLPRRASVRARVPAGTVLFAAGQTAITATALPTGWHVIGTTDFRNFDAEANPPSRLREGDSVRFEVV